MNSARTILSEINPYVPGKPISEVAREYGVTDIVKLASNENFRGPSPLAVKAIREVLPSLHLYPDAGTYSLRKKLSEVHAFDPDGIIPGNGSTEIVELICEAFLEPGRQAITGPQAFFKYRISCQIMGVKPTMVPMPEYRYDVDTIIEAINSSTYLIFIANPNNPTGTYLNRSEIERILDALPPDGILVLDEAYFEFVDRPDYPNGLDYVKSGHRVIVLRTFSKAYGLAGIRCGYALTQPKIAAPMHKVREAFNCSSLAQVAAEAALDDHQFIEATVRDNRTGRIELEEGLKKFNFEVVPSVTNFLLVNFKQPCNQIFVDLLKRGVIIRPMGPYDLPTCCRISVGTPAQHLKLFKALEETL